MDRPRRPVPAAVALAALLASSAVAPGCSTASGSPGADSRPCGTMLPDGSRAYSVRVAPEYPAAAEARGQTGHVALTFSLDRTGRPYNIDVVESEPPGVFDRAAVSALRRWRYCPPRGLREGLRVELEFAP